MHRLPQCHLGNPQVECRNIHQVNQYDTPLSPEVFIPQDIHHVFSDLNFQSDKTKLQRVKIQFITTRVERGETSYDPSMLTKPMIYQERDISRSRERERERERLNTYLLVQTLIPEGGLLPPHRGGR